MLLGAARGAGAAGELYWDTDHATAGIQGGAGNWFWSSSNWYDGAAYHGWNNSGGNTAVMSGGPGGTINITAVTTAAALQVAAGDYTIGAQANGLTLTLSAGTIDVSGGADVTISAALVCPGTVGLTKTGDGELVLAPGAGTTNTIKGSVSIAGGTLTISADGAMGTNAASVQLAGGRLRYAGVADYQVPSARVVSVGAGGGAIDAAGGAVRLGVAGQLTGTGALSKYGAKTLEITGANVGFTGSVRVAEGTLSLRSAAAINGRPIALAGGSVLMLADAPAVFGSDVTATDADGTLTVDRLSAAGVTSAAVSVGAVSVAAGRTLTIAGANARWLSAASVQADGVIRLSGAGLEVRGAPLGTGEVRVGSFGNALPESLRAGLIFSGGGPARAVNWTLSAEDPAAGSVVLASTATSVTLGGIWQGGGAAQESYAVVRDGATVTLGAGERVNLVTADLTGLRTLHAWGNGANNTLEIASGFVADRTAGGTVAAGLGAIELKDLTLLTRSSAGLPVVTKQDGQGGTHRAGLITLTGTGPAAWQVATAAQTYDGGVRVDAGATIRTDQDLTHTGLTGARWDGQFQVPSGTATLTKTGAATLTLAGAQGYAPGAAMDVREGAVRMAEDPGAGWYAGNYVRAADGSVTAPPVPAGTLAISVGAGTNAASLELGAPVSRLASMNVGGKGSVTVPVSPAAGGKVVTTRGLSVAAGGVVDLGNNRLVIDYDPASASPGLTSAQIEALVKRGRDGGPAGTRWQGDGVTASAARAAGSGLAVGVGEASAVLGISGPQTAPYGGATVDASTVLVAVTLEGDATLDGRVNLDDLVVLANHYGTKGGAHWAWGDFDYSGSVDLDDLVMLANQYGRAADGAGPAPAGAFAADWAAVQATTVPEPSAVTWVGAGVIWGLGRRRRTGRS